MSEDRQRIQTLIGIWTAAGQIREKEERLEDEELDEFVDWLQENDREANASLRDEPKTQVEQEDEEAIALNMALNTASSDTRPPPIAPEAWESRAAVITELIQMGELKTALDLIAAVDDDYNAGNMLFAAFSELMKSDIDKAIELMRTPGYTDKVGWYRMSELWTMAYLADRQPFYLDKAMKSCAACADRRLPGGAVQPLMMLWKATGYAQARAEAEKIASTQEQPENQALAYNVIGRAAGEPDKFLSGFAAAELIKEQGLRVNVARRLITTIVNMCFRLIPEIAKAHPSSDEPTMSAEQLKFVLCNLKHDRWRQSLIDRLQACGIPLP